MSNDKKSSKYVIPSDKEIKQSIKEAVKSKASQKRTANTNTTKSTEKPAATTTEKTTPPSDTSKAKKSSIGSIWDKTPKPVKWVGKNTLKGIIPAASNSALDNINGTSSLYYDPNTGMYVDSADMQAIWQKNLANNNWAYNIPYSAFSKLPDALGEGISDVLRVKDPKARKITSDIINAVSYAIPYYGVGKGIYDIADKASNTIWDTNRDIDMIKDLHYGDLGYSIKYLEDNEYAPIWEGIKTSLANDYMASVADFWGDTLGIDSLKGSVRRTGFSTQSDVYKLGQQTITKMMHKMLEDTNNFDPANVNSRATLNKFNMMNQLLKNSDRYWELQSIKRDNNMSDESFNNYLSNAGIDTNMYRGMEYAAKQLYNLGDNQERNGLKYDNSIISTQAPMLQYKHARKKNPIKDDPLGNLVGGNHILDGYHKVGNTFVNTNPKKVPEPVTEVKEEKKDDTPKKEASGEPVLEFMSPNDPGYIKGDPMTFTKEYNKRHGIKDVTDFYDIWK